MSIINDALKKTQLRFMKPKKKEKDQSDPKPKGNDIVNVYDKLYKDRDDKMKSSSVHVISEKKSRNDSKVKVSRGSKEWLKTVFAVIFLVASVAFSYTFLSNYEPLQDFLRSATGKKRSSRAYIMKHMPKKRTYKAGDLVLNGISVIDGEKVVLINDEIYQIGDVVNNKTITSIGRSEVELRDDKKIYTIKVR